MKRFFAILTLVCSLTVCALGQIQQADLKLRIKTGDGEPSAMYIKGSRQRMDNPSGAMLIQCDLKRMVMLMNQSKTYMVMPFNADGTPSMMMMGAPTAPASAAPPRRGGIVTHTTVITDTGERQQMFGYTARHIKTKMTAESSPDACDKDNSRVETDGWYIDLQFGFFCANDRPSVPQRPQQQRAQCVDEHRYKQAGAGRLGFPLKTTTTVYGEDGQPHTSTMEVVELSRATLDQALFEIPAGYTEMKSMSDYASAMASAAAAANGSDDDLDARRNQPASGDTTTRETATLGPKRPGVIRIGVPAPTVTAGENVNQTALAEAVRRSLIQALNGASVEAVPLEASGPSLIEAEVKRKEIDFVLYAMATHKKGGGGGFGGFMRKAAPVVGSIAMGEGASMGGGTANTSAGISASIKSKDEISLGYELQAPGNSTPLATKTLKGKAKSDGEDIIAPLAAQAASDVLAATKK